MTKCNAHTYIMNCNSQRYAFLHYADGAFPSWRSSVFMHHYAQNEYYMIMNSAKWPLTESLCVFSLCMSLIWFLTALSADTSVYHAMAFDWDSVKMIKPFGRTYKFFYNKGDYIYVWISDFGYWLFLPQKVLRTQNVQVFINRAAIQRVWDANIAQPFLLSY